MSEASTDLLPTPPVILIIEDEDYLAEMLVALLQQQGFRTYVAYDGRSGLAYAEKAQVDAIIVDSMVPLTGGSSLVQRIQMIDKGRTVPILLTGSQPPQPLPPHVTFIPKPYHVDVLLEALQHALAQQPRAADQPSIPAAVLSERYLQALLNRDEYAARAVVQDALTMHMDLETVYYQVIVPSMIEIGRRWQRQQLSVADEHVATAITEQLVNALSLSFAPPVDHPLHPQITIVVGSIAGEKHVIGLRMLADLLRQQQWRVVYLGADVPADDWVDMVRKTRADAIGISAGWQSNPAHVRSLIELLRKTMPAIQILVGGALFDQRPELWKQLGADVYDPDPQAAITLLKKNVTQRS